jgi:hypothetical protein
MSQNHKPYPSYQTLNNNTNYPQPMGNYPLPYGHKVVPDKG